MSRASKIVSLFALAILFIPFSSHAATALTVEATSTQAQIASIKQQIAELQAQLDQLLNGGMLFSASITQFTLPVTMHVDEAGGGLRVIFLGIEHTATPVPASDPFSQPLAEFQLSISPCATYYCPSTQYPAMTTELWPGESTRYQNYTILLNTLNTNSSTATVTVVKN